MGFSSEIARKTSKFLKRIDVFGKSTNLTINNSKTYKTNVGGFFTLAICGLLLALFFNFGSDMINHENPATIYSEVYSKQPEKVSFSKEKYFFMFGVEDGNAAHYIDPSIYDIRLWHHGRNNLDGSKFFQEVEIERCNEGHLPSEPSLKQYFQSASNSPLDQLFCAKNIEELFIEGSFDTEIYASMYISIKVCQNKTDDLSVVCQPMDIIKKKMQGYFAIYSIDYLINPLDYETPGQPVGKDYFTAISVGTKKDITRYIGTTTVNSDNGFLFASKQDYKYPTWISDAESLLLDSTNGNDMFSFMFRKYHSTKNYVRIYKKIQDVLAKLGGFNHVLYLFFWFVIQPFLSKKYGEKIVNLVYNFEDDFTRNARSKQMRLVEPLNLQKSGVTMKSTSGKLFSGASLSLKHKTIRAKKKDTLMRYLEKIKHKPPLTMKFSDYLKSICCSSKKQKQYNKDRRRINAGEKAIEEKLDVAYLLKKFYEIDKLKVLLLNPDQFYLFDYLPKPVILKNANIDIGSSQGSRFRTSETGELEDLGTNLLNAYQNIKKQNKLSTIDEKLIGLLDENIKKLLEANSEILQNKEGENMEKK